MDWAEFYTDNKTVLLAAARAKLGSGGDPALDAEGLVTEALIKVMTKGPTVLDDPLAYTLTVIRGTGIDMVRRTATGREARNEAEQRDVADRRGVPADSVEDQVVDKLFNETIVEALADLPEPERHAVEEHVMAGRTAADVGQELGVTGQAVSQRRTKGISILRQDSRVRRLLDVSEAPNPNASTAP